MELHKIRIIGRVYFADADFIRLFIIVPQYGLGAGIFLPVRADPEYIYAVINALQKSFRIR